MFPGVFWRIILQESQKQPTIHYSFVQLGQRLIKKDWYSILGQDAESPVIPALVLTLQLMHQSKCECYIKTPLPH